MRVCWEVCCEDVWRGYVARKCSSEGNSVSVLVGWVVRLPSISWIISSANWSALSRITNISSSLGSPIILAERAVGGDTCGGKVG